MSTNPTWYDLLDVDRTASAAEIRAAWRTAIDGLDPTDRRFRTLSDAAAVLLDPAARAAYDAGLPAQERDEEPAEEPVEEPAEEPAGEPVEEPAGEPVAVPEAVGAARAAAPVPDRATQPRRPTRAGAPGARPRVPVVAGRWLAVLGVLAALAGTAAAISLARDHGEATVTVANANDSVNVADDNKPLSHDYVTTAEPEGAAALQAAKTAVVPLLSYDYRHMAASQQRAEAYLTDAYRQKYDQIFALLKQNAPNTKTIVRTNAPIDAGLTLVSPDRVEVLVFVDRPTTNKLHKQPIEYQDYVTLTMANVDGSWLVDDMQTTPAG